MVMVMCTVVIALSMCYAIARSSMMVALISTRESADARSARAAQSAVALAMTRLRAEPNWAGTLDGQFGDGERYQVTVRCADDSTRVLQASGVAYDSSQRVLADRRLQVTLRKHALEGQPDSSIVATGANDVGSLTTTVEVDDGVRVVGRIKARGHVRGAAAEWLDRRPPSHGHMAKRAIRIDTDRFRRYTIGCTEYQAECLDRHGRRDTGGRLRLDNVVLGPSSANPLGVYYHDGDLRLDDGVFVRGTLAVHGSVWVEGSGVRLLSIGLPQEDGEVRFPTLLAARDVHFGDDADCVRIRGVVAAGGSVLRARQDRTPERCPHDHDENYRRNDDPAARDKDDRQRSNDGAPDDDKLSDDDPDRPDAKQPNPGRSTSSSRRSPQDGDGPAVPEPVPMPAPDSLTQSAIKPSELNLMADCDGPAIQIDGAILAKRAELKHCLGRPFQISFKRTVADVSNAPGFHDWKVNEWRDGRVAGKSSPRAGAGTGH
jgi:hypothetical protein